MYIRWIARSLLHPTDTNALSDAVQKSGKVVAKACTVDAPEGSEFMVSIFTHW